MICLGIVIIVLVVRKNERPLPRGGVQWAAAALSICVIFASGLLLALSLAMDRETDLAGQGVDEPAPDFAFRLVDGDTEQHLRDFKGRVVLLNFWATWCRPCITELPDLDRLHADYRSTGLTVITVSDEPRDALMLYKDLLPKETVSGLFDVAELPEPFSTELQKGRPISYVIDRGGVVRHYVIGAGNYDSFERLVKPLIAARVAS